jgi:hypothetical protein
VTAGYDPSWIDDNRICFVDSLDPSVSFEVWTYDFEMSDRTRLTSNGIRKSQPHALLNQVIFLEDKDGNGVGKIMQMDVERSLSGPSIYACGPILFLLDF